jgi:phosphomannomutase
MDLIKSISGIRGIIGTGLTPPEILKFTAAYAALLRERNSDRKLKVVIGRDSRVSGKMVVNMVSGTLIGSGVDVVDLGLATTPTVEMAVIGMGADGGIIVTASHNPAHWNALKLLNREGEFLSAADGERILELAGSNHFEYVAYDKMGRHVRDYTWLEHHIRKIIGLPLVDVEAIKMAGFRVAFDAVNSVGGIALPMLLEALGVSDVVPVNATPDGRFPHNPEPLPEHLGEIAAVVKKEKCSVGFAVDPDVDRLAVIMEDGKFFGEEYTLVAVADFVLQSQPGNTVSNLSSTRALADVTANYGGEYFASAVGEVNVVDMMKSKQAVIGGEGNGGVIYPELHYGRDALAGIALFLSYMATSGLSCSEIRKKFPDYFISKNKVELKENARLEDLFGRIREIYHSRPINAIDGLRIDFEDGWVHLRQSNTEPIMRIYAESTSEEKARERAAGVIAHISPWVC